MAKILLSANPAKPTKDGWFSVVLHLDGRGDPFPPRLVDVKTTHEALAALEQYKADAAATGQLLAVCMKLREGRAPNGFKAATAALPFYHRINV